MALIKCPECGKEISDTASSCPNCGFSIRKKQKSIHLKKHMIKIVIIVFAFLLCAGTFWKLCVNEKYPLDSKTIGRQITDSEIKRISKIKNVQYRDDGNWQTLRYIKEITMEDISMSKTINIEDNKIISVGIGVTLVTDEMSAFQNDTMQIMDSSAELEKKGSNIFKNLVNDAITKHGENYEYTQEPYDEQRNHEKYEWVLDNGVIYGITVLWGKNDNNEMIHCSVECHYMKEDL
ncbi:MAG: zinc ribbon domain-containing protein [Lachnospiraceae bacterium]|nr:zinc ribbon domain-containing protein [Lachnospiraceae bacterium]